MAICPRCGSDKGEFRREDGGYRTTAVGTKREYRTVGFCRECGYTWTEDGSSLKLPRAINQRSATKNNRSSSSRSSKSDGCLVSLVKPVLMIGLIILVLGWVWGKVNSFRRLFYKTDYNVTSENAYLVHNPSADYIVQALSKVDGIYDITVATIEDDPNHLFSSGEATSVVFFAYKDVNQEEIDGDSIIEKGTDAGGCIEVFADDKTADKREKQVGLFSFAGSHAVIGTVVVRTSYLLPLSTQIMLESQICQALLNPSGQ